MPARLSTPAGRALYGVLRGGGLDLASTRGRTMYWLEGLLELLGEDGAGRLVTLLLEKARTKRSPEAWFNWAAARSWSELASDEEIRWVRCGPPPPPRAESSIESVGRLCAQLAGLHGAL